MFERFTDRARQVVVLAQQEARGLHHGWIGTEHLLLGLLAERQGIGATVLTQAGLDLEGARAEIQRLVAADPKADADALQSIGIDLDAVRAKVEETFGPGALERGQDCDRRGRRRVRTATGHIPFTGRAKQVSCPCARPWRCATTTSAPSTSCSASCARAGDLRCWSWSSRASAPRCASACWSRSARQPEVTS